MLKVPLSNVYEKSGVAKATLNAQLLMALSNQYTLQVS